MPAAPQNSKSGFVLGVSLVASLVGGLCESWLLFWLVWGGLLLCCWPPSSPPPGSRRCRRH